MIKLKKTVCVVLSLVMVLSLAACGGIQKQVAPKGDNLVFKAIGNWTEVKSNAMANYTLNTAGVIAVWEKTSDTDVSAYIAKWKDSYSSQFENFTVIDEGDQQIAGQNFKRVEFTAKVATIDMQYTYFFLIRNGYLYTVSIADTQAKYPESRQLMLELLNSAVFE